MKPPYTATAAIETGAGPAPGCLPPAAVSPLMHSRKIKALSATALLLVTAALLAFTACSSNSGSGKSSPSTGPGSYADPGSFGGQMIVDSLTRTDTVVSVNAAQRLVELKHADGKISSYQCGPQVANFDRIKAGDQVKATVVDEMAVYLKPASTGQTLTATDLTVRARLGAKPGVVSLDTLTFTARIMAIDPWQHQVTLQTADGRTKAITVSEFINLADFNVGDQVSVRLTQALAVLVENP